jgi:hypothetical protein
MTDSKTRREMRPDRLGEALRGLGLGHAPQRPPRHPVRHPAGGGDSVPAGDLTVRLVALEDNVREIRTRINALFFAVLTAALGDLAGRVVLG